MIRKFLISIFIFASASLQVIATENDFPKDSLIHSKTVYYGSRIWPREYGEKYIKDVDHYAISLILQRNDTLVIVSTAPKLFQNDNYVFHSKPEVIEEFSHCAISFDDDIPDIAAVHNNYGDYLIFNGLLSAGSPYGLVEGRLCTNSMFSISRHCQIGTDINEFYRYLRLDKLGVKPQQKHHYYIIIIGGLFYTNPSMRKNHVVPDYDGVIDIQVVDDKIYTIHFNYESLSPTIYPVTEGN